VNELTKQQSAALLAVARKDPAWAIQQAFRFGAASVGSDETQAAIKRLTDIMENDAEEIKATYHGMMPSEAKQDYLERKKMAKVLRGMLGKED
jgi:uncharacterized pyridoxal phosphate-containing UPF0001 family protein